MAPVREDALILPFFMHTHYARAPVDAVTDRLFKE